MKFKSVNSEDKESKFQDILYFFLPANLRVYFLLLMGSWEQSFYVFKIAYFSGLLKSKIIQTEHQGGVLIEEIICPLLLLTIVFSI